MKEVVIPVDRCVECGSKANIVFHHLIPESKGGRFTLPVCQMCHDRIHGVKKPRNISLSKLTKDGLKRAKRNGVKLGNPRYKEAIPKAVEAWKQLAADRNAGLRKTVVEVMKKTGLTKLADIAEALNLRGIKTPRGCAFSPTHIHRLLKAV